MKRELLFLGTTKVVFAMIVNQKEERNQLKKVFLIETSIETGVKTKEKASIGTKIICFFVAIFFLLGVIGFVYNCSLEVFENIKYGNGRDSYSYYGPYYYSLNEKERERYLWELEQELEAKEDSAYRR